jgi:hypothetical protein
MPRGDGTGPAGMGPMTGRGAGFCAGYHAPGFADAAPGRFFFGRGGRGRRNRFHATGRAGWMRGDTGFRPFGAAAPRFSPEDEHSRLVREADDLERALSGLRDRINRIKTESTA